MFDFEKLSAGLRTATKFPTTAKLLKVILEVHGIKDVAYFVMNLPQLKGRSPLVAATYNDRWQSHYVQHGYAQLDPVITAAMSSEHPIDWAELNTGDPFVRKFFQEAVDFSIGPKGFQSRSAANMANSLCFQFLQICPRCNGSFLCGMPRKI